MALEFTRILSYIIQKLRSRPPSYSIYITFSPEAKKSEGIAQAIITQNVTFRSGFHAKSMHFSPLHRFKTYPCYHFSPLKYDRWYVIGLHMGSPLSENDTKDDQRF